MHRMALLTVMWLGACVDLPPLTSAAQMTVKISDLALEKAVFVSGGTHDKLPLLWNPQLIESLRGAYGARIGELKQAGCDLCGRCIGNPIEQIGGGIHAVSGVVYVRERELEGAIGQPPRTDQQH